MRVCSHTTKKIEKRFPPRSVRRAGSQRAWIFDKIRKSFGFRRKMKLLWQSNERSEMKNSFKMYRFVLFFQQRAHALTFFLPWLANSTRQLELSKFHIRVKLEKCFNIALALHQKQCKPYYWSEAVEWVGRNAAAAAIGIGKIQNIFKYKKILKLDQRKRVECESDRNDETFEMISDKSGLDGYFHSISVNGGRESSSCVCVCASISTFHPPEPHFLRFSSGEEFPLVQLWCENMYIHT